MRTIFKFIIVRILSLEARLILRRHAPLVVAVTGSVGKTSMKDAVCTALAARFHVRKSQKSFNSEFGVPLTILGLQNAWTSPLKWIENLLEGAHTLVRRGEYPACLVLEVGVDRPGDMRALRWLRPHVVVFTRFPDVPVHVEYFASPEAVIEEKRELRRALRPHGTLVVNLDDPNMRDEMVTETQRILSYGYAHGATVRGSNYRVVYERGVPVGFAVTAVCGTSRASVVVRGTLGKHHTYPVLAALTVAYAQGIPFEEAVQALTQYVPPPGRMRILNGVNGSVVLDDTYNASPAAVEAGLQALADLSVSGRRIAVLGDMLELGTYSVEAHRRIGERVAAVASMFIAVGVRMQAAADAARACGVPGLHVELVRDATEAGVRIRELVRVGDVVVVKGSQSMRMEGVVETLLADPTHTSLLVRQETEWKTKR